MSISNLAVCFGPTLLRPREETLAAVMDIKFCNVVVEALIANCEHIFGKSPPQQIEQPFPPKPAKSGHLTNISTNNEGEGSKNIILVDESNKSTSLSSSKSSGGYDELLSVGTQQNRPLKPAITPFNSTDGTTILSTSTTSPHQFLPTSPQRRPFNGSGSTLKQKPSIISKQFESRSELCLTGSGVGDSPSSSSTPPPSSSGDRNTAKPGIAPRGGNIYATLRTSPSKNPSSTQQQRPSSSSSQTTSTTPIILSNRSETLPTILSMRIPPAYTNFINPDGPLHPPRRVRTIYPCEAGHETELSFESGQIITNVYESKEEGWLVGTLNGEYF
uniref:SH3 domain-containing protein n=1 Tax=Meloidogyne hapla TaxID=6305 RepID=A0A1I8AXX6_MELHA